MELTENAIEQLAAENDPAGEGAPPAEASADPVDPVSDEPETLTAAAAGDVAADLADVVHIGVDMGDPASDSTVVSCTLDRLVLAQALPVVGADAEVLPTVPLAPGSIEAFRSLDGKTMLVVAVADENGFVSLAAQEIQPTEGVDHVDE